MTVTSDIFPSCGDGVAYVPDLTLWYNWHESRGTLPERWRGSTLAAVADDLGVPAFDVARPWRLTTSGVQESSQESESERVIEYETSRGTLTARWTLGPDGDWWQMEHFIKSVDDLPAALELAGARTYSVDSGALERAQREAGENGAVAVELPDHPYTEVLYNFLGTSEGPIMLADPPDELGELMDLLARPQQELLAELVQLPATSLFLAFDNLDAMFISPPAFEQWLAPGYASTAELLHTQGKRLIVHAGGPINRLLPALAAAGVDAVEGVCGPPQGDASLAQARQHAGGDMVVWGGIAQDFLLEATEPDEFEAAVAAAASEAGADDEAAVIGVADRVPTGADLSRLEAIPELIQRALSQ